MVNFMVCIFYNKKITYILKKIITDKVLKKTEQSYIQFELSVAKDLEQKTGHKKLE